MISASHRRDGIRGSAPRPDDHIIVLFGATGDLARRKLLPGLFHLFVAGLMPDRYRIIGSARRALTDEQFREHARQSLAEFGVSKPAGRAWEWNQALFDLGAQVCLGRVPRCDRCPLAASCPARGQTFAPLRRQSRFEGSRRQRRAVLVRELAEGPRAEGGYDRDVVASLLADGLAVRRADGLLALPEEVTAS